MGKPFQAMGRSSWTERFVLVAFIAGSILAGKHLADFLQRRSVVAPLEKKAAPAPVQSEWNEVHLFSEIASLDKEVEYQKSLTHSVHQALERTLPLVYVNRVVPPILHSMTAFEDYTIRPSVPFPGSVFKLQNGPRCIEFSWSEIPLPGVRYTLELAKTRDFAFFRSFGSETNSVRVQASRKSDFFWRVRATYQRQDSLSPFSTFLVTEPRLSAEQRKMRDLASRARDPNAWLTDLSVCR
jgi:hypothetical protein